MFLILVLEISLKYFEKIYFIIVGNPKEKISNFQVSLYLSAD